MEMRYSGQALAKGTGFLCSSTNRGLVLITNRHNVTGRNQQTGQPLSNTSGVPDEIAISHHRVGEFGAWVTAVEPLYANGSPLWFEHPVLGATADFVALPLTQLTDVKPFTYDPVRPGGVAVGPADPISVIGFPFGLRLAGSFPVWATGFVASEPEIDYLDTPTFLIDCRTRPGQSGSPVVAYRSGLYTTTDNSVVANGVPGFRFLGIYSGRVNSESDLGIVWKARAIAELIQTM